MRIFNQQKNKELKEEDIDFKKGYLKFDIIIHHIEAKEEVKQESHYEVIEEYPNGGKDVKEIIDIPYQAPIEEHDEEEEIQIYIPYSKDELDEIKINELRQQREIECFSIINRGQLWYDLLTDEQIQELKEWYQKWLDVTEDLIIPEKPSWL